MQLTMPIGLKGRTIGILEDDEHIDTLVREVVGFLGFSPVSISSAAEALELVRSGDMAAFVLDIDIQGVNLGLDILEEIKQHNIDTFVCLYSWHLEKASIKNRAKRLHADFTLQKTANDKDDIIRIAQAILNHQIKILHFHYSLLELDRENASLSPHISGVSPVSHITGTEPSVPSANALWPLDKMHDPNYLTFAELSANMDWFRAHKGMWVGIVEGVQVHLSVNREEVLELIETRFPTKNRFLQLVGIGDDDDAFEIPTPVDMEV